MEKMSNWNCELQQSGNVNSNLNLNIEGSEGFQIVGNNATTIDSAEFHYVIVEIQLNAGSNNSQSCTMTKEFSHKHAADNNFEILLVIDGNAVKGTKPKGQISRPKK